MAFWGKKSSTGFSGSSTAEEVTEGVDATGLTAFVTGGTSGIGKETVRVLAKRGATVFLGARNVEKAKQVKDELLQANPSSKIDVIEIDTSSLASVRKAADEFLSLGVPLNILVNNAGIMFVPFRESKDGIELQFATNYLGHFLLTNLLLDNIKATASKSGREGKIINVSSLGHRVFEYPGGIRFENLNSEEGYSEYRSYGQSKLAQILTTQELSKRLQEEGANVTVNALHPGNVTTNLANDHRILAPVCKVLNFVKAMKTPAQGAATQCYLALNPGAKGVTGKFYDADVSDKPSPSKFVKDADLQAKLWDFSVELTEAES